MQAKLFWIVQLGYCIIPSIQLATTIIIAPNLARVVLSDVTLASCRCSSTWLCSSMELRIFSSSGKRHPLGRNGGWNWRGSSAQTSSGKWAPIRLFLIYDCASSIFIKKCWQSFYSVLLTTKTSGWRDMFFYNRQSNFKDYRQWLKYLTTVYRLLIIQFYQFIKIDCSNII